MIQELFRIGSFAISPFGVMLVAALLASYVQLYKEMRRLSVGNDEDASSITVVCGFWGIIGGKIYYAALYGDWRLFFSRSGIVWYGCFLLGVVALLLLLRHRKLPYAKTFDATAPALALGYGIGRIGCFLVGDDYGQPTDLPWGMVFKVGLPATNATNLREFGYEIAPGTPGDAWVAVHPTQLYETALALIIWGLVLAFARRENRPQPGSTFLFALGLLAVERFSIEFLRAKDDRFFGTLTLAQVISISIVVVVTGLALKQRQRAATA